MVVDHTFCPTWSTPVPYMGFSKKASLLYNFSMKRDLTHWQSAKKHIWTGCRIRKPTLAHLVRSLHLTQCVSGHATEKAVSEQGDRKQNQLRCTTAGPSPRHSDDGWLDGVVVDVMFSRQEAGQTVDVAKLVTDGKVATPPDSDIQPLLVFPTAVLMANLADGVVLKPFASRTEYRNVVGMRWYASAISFGM